MEGNSGSYTDKTRVLDIKPLRTLRPIFPSGNQAPPFVCAPPFGPFPSGFSSFYPFTSSQVNDQTPDLSQAQNPPQRQPQIPPQPLVPHQQQPQAPPQQQLQNLSERSLATTPLRPFRSPVTTSNGEIEPEGSTVRRKTPKKRQLSNFESGITVAERDNGNRELVMSVLMRFDALRRRLAQLEDAEDAVNGIIKRPDLKAGSTCMSRGVRTNTKKRPGLVPGVEIGDIFFFRFEMCLVGLHSPSMAGIDYLVVKGEDSEEEPIATSIVSSGYNENDRGNTDVLIYTGQGGHADKDKEASDQKLERGNLALEKSLHKNSLVRVIRGLKEATHRVKIYVYDGLFEIKEAWIEKGKTGHDTFKYKLVRAPGQPPAFATWTEVQKWRTGKSTSRNGLILPDLTSGVESVAVSLVNEVDNENGPAYFTYSTTVKYSMSFQLTTQRSSGCGCGNKCKPGNLECHCIRRNGGDFPYTGNDILVCRKPMVYECSPSCPCLTCKSKVTQMGVKVRLEVFKTVNRGWGLRSWDPIRAGAFICVYAGEARDKSKVQQTMANDDYTFDTTRVYTPFKWNYEHGLADEDASSEEMSEEPELPLPLIISAKNIGNVARFMNHSCSPNVFWQPVSYENNGQLHLHVAFFAMSHIPPMTELTYDYGVTRPSGAQNGNPMYGKKRCFCGTEYCRGSFG
ncbi:Histone-lysine N-methyltransferase [Hirschfeldia incana]|nr:Histone-lysine N-methyltransferase [Hirschfeldia incana]KAJ0266388.1 Histone-lysine N-methyltransferase [Hirschfeldia incana]